MKENVLPFACAAAKSAPVNIRQLAAPRRRQPSAASSAARRRNSPAASRDYFISVGSATFQVSIASVDGVRLFRLKQSGGGPLTFTDSGATEKRQRFYRVEAQ